MNLRINGEDREVVDNVSLKELVTQLDLTPERIAIELNQHVVRRADWPSTVLRENDQIEIVHFVGGGEGNIFHLSFDFCLLGFRCKLS